MDLVVTLTDPIPEVPVSDSSSAPREVRLVSRPVGWPEPGDFELVESDVPALAEGQLRVRNVVMSVDPYMRGRMSDAKSYAAPFELGRAMEGGGQGPRGGVEAVRASARGEDDWVPVPPPARQHPGGMGRGMEHEKVAQIS